MIVCVDGLSVPCATKSKLEQIRLALRPTGVTVSWTTDGYLLVADDTPSPQVSYSTNANGPFIMSSPGFTTSYHLIPVFKKFFHNVHLDGLQPSTKYYYYIQASKYCVLQSDTYSFITAPPADTSAQLSINISIVGDLGLNNIFNNNQAGKTVDAMQQYVVNSNIFLHIGDISYADLFGLGVDFKLYEDT